MYSLCRYLRDRGYDAHLILFKDEPEQFMPIADSYNVDYSYIHQSKWSNLPTDLWRTSDSDIRNTLKDFNFIIGCGAAPAYCNKAGVKLDLMIPYGSDVYARPFLLRYPWRGIRKLWVNFFMSYLQYKGIKEASHIMMDYTNYRYESLLPRNINDRRIYTTPPFIYIPEYGASLGHGDSNINKFKTIRNQTDFVAFHHSRHEWGEGIAHGMRKGNDKLIKGFAKFVNSKPEVSASLIMFDYGSTVYRSKELVRKLGIEDKVNWMPLMPRKSIMAGIGLSDVGIGGLEESFITYGAVSEFMAKGVPIIQRRSDDSNYRYPEMYPMINAYSDDSVAEALDIVYTNRREAKRMGEEAKSWFEKYVISESIKEIELMIKSK